MHAFILVKIKQKNLHIRILLIKINKKIFFVIKILTFFTTYGIISLVPKRYKKVLKKLLTSYISYGIIQNVVNMRD